MCPQRAGRGLVVVNGADGSPGTAAQPRELNQLLHQHGLVEQLDQLLEEVLAAGRSASIAAGGHHGCAAGGWQQPAAGRAPDGSPIACWAGPIQDRRPVEAVALGALALTPGVQVQDVLSRGVSLRCWDRRSNRHLWHPLFVAGQSWPTTSPLELVLACREHQQQRAGAGAGRAGGRTPHRGGVRHRRAAGAQGHERRRGQRAALGGATPPLAPGPAWPQGEDRLRLRFSINASAELELESTDLLSGISHPPQRLGRVR
jgi:hypothetical protein